MVSSDSTPSPRIVYIYALAHPETGDVRYIGITTNLARRYSQHLYDRHSKNTHRKAWVSQLRRDGLKPTITVLEETDEGAWEQREQWWIAEGRARGWQLTNLADGGRGLLYPTPEARRKLRERPHTWGDKISAGKMGHEHSTDAKEHMSASRTAYYDQIGRVSDMVKTHLQLHPDDARLSCRALGVKLGVVHHHVSAAKKQLGYVVTSRRHKGQS